MLKLERMQRDIREMSTDPAAVPRQTARDLKTNRICNL